MLYFLMPGAVAASLAVHSHVLSIGPPFPGHDRNFLAVIGVSISEAEDHLPRMRRCDTMIQLMKSHKGSYQEEVTVMKTRSAKMLAVGMFLLAMSAEAQNLPPGGPPFGGPPNLANPAQAAQKILNLTDAQVQQLIQLRQSYMANVQNLRTNLRNLQQQIAALLKSSNPDPTQIGTLVIQRQDLEHQFAAAHTTYHNSALGVLTQAQKDQLAQIQAAVNLAVQAAPLAPLGLIDPPPVGGLRGGLGALFGGFGFGGSIPEGPPGDAPGQNEPQ